MKHSPVLLRETRLFRAETSVRGVRITIQKPNSLPKSRVVRRREDYDHSQRT